MKYLIGIILLVLSSLLTLAVAYCVYMGFTDSYAWFLVAMGIFLPDLVAFMAFTAAVSVLKNE